MKKKLNSNPISEFDLLSKNGVWDYYRAGDRSWYTHDPEWVRKLKNTLLAWANKESSLEIQQFIATYKIPSTSYERALDKNPDLKEIHKEVMRILGTRKKIGALTRKFSTEMVLKDLHTYLPEWHEDVNKYHSKLKAEAEAAALVVDQKRLEGLIIQEGADRDLLKEKEKRLDDLYQELKKRLEADESAALEKDVEKEIRAVLKKDE